MFKKYYQLIAGIILGAVIVLAVGKLVMQPKADLQPQSSNNTNHTYQAPKPSRNGTANQQSSANIPNYATQVLAYIKANGKAIQGYVGGRVFTNREGNLPKQDAQGNHISYQEWDVLPKQQGVNRGAERICTGSDGRSWYTSNHYRSFTLMP